MLVEEFLYFNIKHSPVVGYLKFVVNIYEAETLSKIIVLQRAISGFEFLS